MGSFTTPSPIDRLIYGFAGPDACNLATVHVPPATFKSSGPYNILDGAAAICTGLDTLPQDQLYHSYVIAGMPDMMTSTCKHAIVLLSQWYGQLAEHFLDRIKIKDFHDKFLATMTMTVTGIAGGLLHMVETHHIKKHRRYIKSLLFWTACSHPTSSDTGDPYQM